MTVRDLTRRFRIGVGVLNQKRELVEAASAVLARARRAVELLGADRVLLTPDCGFATFADNPVASARAAEAALGHVAHAAATLRGG
jgi:5-methyltetrahydropteroyltriglutamate--homocysteine methyltransferase